MKMFKVLFENNKPISSSEVDFSHKVTIETELLHGRKVVKSIVLFANDSAESMQTAANIIRYSGQ